MQVGGGFKTQVIGRVGPEEFVHLLQGVISEYIMESYDESRNMEQGGKRKISLS
jgi:hypothetical protein